MIEKTRRHRQFDQLRIVVKLASFCKIGIGDAVNIVRQFFDIFERDFVRFGERLLVVPVFQKIPTCAGRAKPAIRVRV